jgi:D-arginine dehydrogenase
MDRYDAVIIGGGFAGAATAWWLKRAGLSRVIILEQEELPGMHASGKNAGIARQAVSSVATSLLAARSVSFMKNPPDGFCDHPLVDENGGLLISTLPDDPRLEQLRKNALAAGVFTYFVERLEAIQRAPVLQDAPFTTALLCPADGLVDIHALISSYLKGVEVHAGSAVTEFVSSPRKIQAVKTAHATYHAESFVNAAGAWAPKVGRMAGTASIKITPRRRHLIHTGALDWVDARLPYVWSLDPAVYFRPESGGLLLSPCDETEAEPGTPPTDPDAPLWLAEKLTVAAPALASLPTARAWAELRSFAPDDDFVVGRDPSHLNFFWVCGLGGHGMTTSAAVGELAAAVITGAVPPVDPAPYDPKRFGS